MSNKEYEGEQVVQYDLLMRLYNSAIHLQKYEECEDIVSLQVSLIEDIFKNVKEVDGQKNVNNKLFYYPNGLISNINGNLPWLRNRPHIDAIMASPWTTKTSRPKLEVESVPLKEITEPKKKSIQRDYLQSVIYDSNEFKYRIYHQLKVYYRQGIPQSKQVNLPKFLQKVELLKQLDDNEITALKISKLSYRRYTQIILSLLAIIPTKEYPFFFTNDECESLDSIYSTIQSDYRMGYSEKIKKKAEWIKKFLTKTTQSCNHIQPNLSCYRQTLEEYNSKITKERINFYKKSNNCRYTHVFKLSAELKEGILDTLKELYHILYTIKDKNIRTMLIRAKIIEEGYVPK